MYDRKTELAQWSKYVFIKAEYQIFNLTLTISSDTYAIKINFASRLYF